MNIQIGSSKIVTHTSSVEIYYIDKKKVPNIKKMNVTSTIYICERLWPFLENTFYSEINKWMFQEQEFQMWSVGYCFFIIQERIISWSAPHGYKHICLSHKFPILSKESFLSLGSVFVKEGGHWVIAGHVKAKLGMGTWELWNRISPIGNVKT